MKVEIPDEIKRDLPPTMWGKMLSATPVVMTVLATALAGLSSSEMTRAQYDRSTAAQLQSKAGDQWAFFQAKRLRGALQANSLDLLTGFSGVQPLDAAALTGAAAGADELRAFAHSPEAAALFSGAAEKAAETDVLAAYPKVKAAAAAVADSRPEAEVNAMLAGIENSTLQRAMADAVGAAQQFDAAKGPHEKAVAQLERLLARSRGTIAAESAANLSREFAAFKFSHEARRYETEARLNQTIAAVYELEVRKTNIAAERHHVRSQRFFYGMLGAQMAVIISTLALAARNRSFLWSLSAAAGLAALAFALYVYLAL